MIYVWIVPAVVFVIATIWVSWLSIAGGHLTDLLGRLITTWLIWLLWAFWWCWPFLRDYLRDRFLKAVSRDR